MTEPKQADTRPVREPGGCRATGCHCGKYDEDQLVAGWPTCYCGHTKNIHEVPDEANQEARRK